MTSNIDFDDIVKLIEDDNEEETYNENISDIFGNLIDDSNPHCKLYIINASTFINNIKNWEYNRSLDIKHVNNIYQEQLKYKINNKVVPYFAGNFIVSKYLENDKPIYRLIDGQHRLEVIKKLINDGIDDFKIRVELIDVNNDYELIKKFKDINTSKPLNCNDLPETKLVITINEIKKLYINYFSKSDKPILPNTNDKIFSSKLKEHNIFDKYNITPNDLVILIRKMNTIKLKQYQTMFNTTKLTRDQIKLKVIYDKALVKGNFVLTIDPKYEWIIEMIDILDKEKL